MRKITFLIVLFILFVTGLDIAQQPAPVKVEEGLLQGTLTSKEKF